MYFTFMKEGHIFTDIPIDLEYPNYIENQLRNIGNVDKIVHHISSPGGSVYGGYKGFQKLRAAGKPIKTIIEGEAQSMATFMAMAGDEILIMDPSRFMIHNPHQEAFGDASALEENARELRRIEDEMAEVYAKRTGKPVATIKEMMKKETKMTAREAVEFGFCDSIIDNRIDKKVYETLKAAAMGTEQKDEVKSLIEKIEQKIEGLFKKEQPKAEPKAVDLALKDGKMLNVESEDGILIGKPATVDGAPAPDGTHELADGKKIVTVGGVVTEILEPETPEQKQIADLQAKLQALEAEKAAQAEAAKKAEEQVQVTAKAAEEIKAQFEEIKKKTVGDDNPPKKGDKMEPTAIGKTSPQALGIYASRTFIADHMPWMEQYYQGGKYKDGTRFMDYRSNGPNAVSILETNLNYTWNGVLSTELFFKPTLSSPALADIFTIDLGATDKKRYHIAPNYNKVLKPYTGCDQAVTGSSYDITSKAIQLKPFQMYESFCKDDFTNQLSGQYNVLAQEWLKTGTESFDPAGTPIDRIIVEALKDSLRRDIFRRVSFGDISSSSADWNQIDGLWPNLIDQSGSQSNYCVYRAATIGTGALSSGNALTYLTNVFENSSALLKEQGIDMGKGKFLVTRSIWENLYASYAATGAVTEQAFTNQVKGLPSLTFRGIPVVPVTIWDDMLTDAANPLFGTAKHLIAFTVKDNHILGIENTADLNKIDSWFEKKDNKRYYRANMVMGFLGAIHCDLTTIAY
jgi:ATP-dependent Clp endopeptidase proteolytic subunit ClpP